LRFDPIWRLQRSATLALILSPVGILVVAAARLLVIAGYSTVTASAIVTSDGYVNALLGSVIPVVQILLPYVALVLLFFRRFIPGSLALIVAGLISPSRLDSRQALSAASKDLHRISPWFLSHLWIAPIAIVAALLLLAVLFLGINAFVRTIGTLLALALVSYIAEIYPLHASRHYYEALVTLPWIPAQEITLTSGKTVVGFVLSNSDVSMEVLLSSPRSVVYYPNRLIKRQKICNADPSVERGPLIRLVSAKSTTPPCPTPATARPALPVVPIRPGLPVPG
jgi:hypothetical protein